MLIALDKKKIQSIILTIQKIVGVNLVKLSVVFKNPLDAMPVITPNIK